MTGMFIGGLLIAIEVLNSNASYCQVRVMRCGNLSFIFLVTTVLLSSLSFSKEKRLDENGVDDEDKLVQRNLP